MKGAKKCAVLRGGYQIFCFLKWETLDSVFLLMERIMMAFLNPLNPLFHVPCPTPLFSWEKVKKGVCGACSGTSAPILPVSTPHHLL